MGRLRLGIDVQQASEEISLAGLATRLETCHLLASRIHSFMDIYIYNININRPTQSSTTVGVVPRMSHLEVAGFFSRWKLCE